MLTSDARKQVREALQADGRLEAEIVETLDDIATFWDRDDDEDEYRLDGWMRQQRSTLPSRGGHL